jgi:hypothetical protein
MAGYLVFLREEGFFAGKGSGLSGAVWSSGGSSWPNPAQAGHSSQERWNLLTPAKKCIWPEPPQQSQGFFMEGTKWGRPHAGNPGKTFG